MLGRYEVDLRPQLHRLGDALARLGQESRGCIQRLAMLSSRSGSGAKSRVKSGKSASPMCPAPPDDPAHDRYSVCQWSPSRAWWIARSRSRARSGLSSAGIEPGQLVDRSTEEGDLLVDRVAAARGELAIMIVNAEEGRGLRLHRQLVAEPAVDGAIEARVDIGRWPWSSNPYLRCMPPRGRHRSTGGCGAPQLAGARTRSRKPSTQPG